MPDTETKRDGKAEFLAKDLSIWRQTPGPGADAGSGSRIQVVLNTIAVRFRCPVSRDEGGRGLATIRSELFIFRESVYHDIFDVDVNPHAKPDGYGV